MPDLASQRLLMAALVLGCASLAGAWVFEHGFGYLPCKLCLMQRWPYYIGLPVGMAALLAGGGQSLTGRGLVWLFALIFLIGAGIAAYHAGVEWKFWAGPSDCGGRIADTPGNVLDLRNSIRATKIIRCDEAALRILGLSFAGWNVLVSLAVAGLAAISLRRA